MLFLGCDGGATKYAYLLCDEHGRVHVCKTLKGINIITDGMEAFVNGIRAHIGEVFSGTGLNPRDVTWCAFGLSGYGESRSSAKDMTGAVAAALGHERFFICNDSVTGWSGALMLRPGISVAAGTGSVAYGQDPLGHGARAGGWSIRYGDEGSSYWIATGLLNLFFRQADGRLPRTLLYDHFMRKLDLADPLYFPMAIEEYLGSGISRIAAFQREALLLYQLGDPQVKGLYARAAKELAELVAALMNRLSFSAGQPVEVSYSGGLFRGGDCILQPFSREIGGLGAVLTEPAYGPLVGAACYAAKDRLTQDALSWMFVHAGKSLSDIQKEA